MDLLGGWLDLNVEAKRLGLLLEPDSAIVVAADPAKLVGAVTEQCPVVDHAAMRKAHGRVGHLPHRQLADVAGERALQQRLGIGPQHLELAQGRQVDRDAALAAGPVFLDRASLGEAVGQPVAPILDEIAGKCRDARMEPRLLGELQGCVRRHAKTHRALEQVGLGIDPDMDVGQDPAIGGVDVARAGRGGADQVGHRPQQHIVTGPRPGLVEVDRTLRVDHGVEEQIDRGPALLRRQAVIGELAGEVVRAVGVPEIALVLIVAGGAGEVEAVVAADRVLHDLDQRVHLGVEKLGEQTGLGIGAAGERARGDVVDPAQHATVQGPLLVGDEVRALPPAHVDDLDELAGAHEVGLGGSGLNTQLEARIGQGVRQPLVGQQRRRGATHEQQEVGRWVMVPGAHRRAGRRHQQVAGVRRP